MIKAAQIVHFVMQHPFASVAKGRVAEIVRQRQCLSQILT